MANGFLSWLTNIFSSTKSTEGSDLEGAGGDGGDSKRGP